MTLDSAISFLKKRKQEANKVDPTTTLPALLTKLNNNLIGAMADIAQAFYSRPSKTEVTNQRIKVEVSNFPKQKEVDQTPVVKAIREIPQTDVSPIVKAIKEIPTTKPTDITPVVKAIRNLPIPEPIDFSPVVNAIKSIPKPERPVEEVKVKNQVVLDRVESLLSGILKACNAPKTAPEKNDDKLILEELRNQFVLLAEAISDTKVEAVRVTNAGEFPVTFPIPAFRDVNGNIAQATLDAAGRILISDKDPLTEYNVNDSDVASSTKYAGFTKADGSWYIMRTKPNEYRYVAGTSGYTTAWTNRASLTYDYYHNVF